MLERKPLNRDRSLIAAGAACCLAGAIILAALASILPDSAALPFRLPVHWAWFLALGILAGLGRPGQWSGVVCGILALAVLDAVAAVPENGPASGLVTGFIGALAGLAGMHAGRAIALLIDRFGAGRASPVSRQSDVQQGKAGAS